MKRMRNASEEEMLLSFLQSEYRSARFGGDIVSALRSLGIDEAVITRGDPADEHENALRRRVMAVFRGYPDKEIFENFPAQIRWVYAEMEEADLDRVLYLDDDYWNELSSGTGRPAAAAENIARGVTVYDVPNDGFLAARDALLRGVTFPPIVLLTAGEGFLAIEGHQRLTAYAMAPGFFSGAKAYIGICSKESLHRKDKRF